MLKKYKININIEIGASIKSVFYFYKYIYKGPNRVDIIVVRESYRIYSNNLTSDNPRLDSWLYISSKLVDKIIEYYSAR